MAMLSWCIFSESALYGVAILKISDILLLVERPKIELSDLRLRAVKAQDRTEALLDALRRSLADRALLQERTVELHLRHPPRTIIK
jgi:hypothetical protein